MSSIVVPSDEAEPIVVVDLVKMANGKFNSDVMVKNREISGIDVGGGIVNVLIRKESLKIPNPTS